MNTKELTQYKEVITALTPILYDLRKVRTSDVQAHIGESRARNLEIPGSALRAAPE